MRILKFKLDRKSLETIYLTFIRPILEYGDVVWNNYTQYEKEELDKIQTEAAKIASGTTKLISLNALFSESQWESLQDRRHNHQLTLFYKMQNHLAPEYLSSLVPQPVGAVSRYNLRNANNLQTITSRTNLYYQSFLSSAIRGWNNLQIEIKQSDSVNSFFSLVLRGSGRTIPLSTLQTALVNYVYMKSAFILRSTFSLINHTHLIFQWFDTLYGN